MAKVLQCAFREYVAGGTTKYHPCADAEGYSYSAESQAQITYRTAGTLSMLYANVWVNPLTGASTVKTRVNGADGNQSLSVPATTTGEYEDTANTDTIAAGDEVNFQIIAGADGGNFIQTYLTTLFDASANTVIRHAATNGANLTTASTAYYVALAGDMNAATLTIETSSIFDFNSVGTLQNLFANIPVNARSTATDLRIRIDGVNGNLVISITALTTGIFEDTVNTDVIAANNDVNYSITTGTGTGNFIASIFAVEFVTTNSKFHSISWDRSAPAIDYYATPFMALGGNALPNTTEANRKADMNIAATLSNLYIYAAANTRNAATTFDIRVNAASSAVTVSITASTTGAFEDAVNTVAVVATDEVNYRLAASGTSGTITYRALGCLVENTEGGAATLVKDIIQSGVIPFAR